MSENIKEYIKYGTLLFVVLLICSGFYLSIKSESNKNALLLQEQIIKQKELSDLIMRSSNQYVSSKDLEQFAKDNSINFNNLKEDIKKLNTAIQSVQVVTVTTREIIKIEQPSTSTGAENKDPIPEDLKKLDVYGYWQTQQKFKINEEFKNGSVPFGEVGFSAWQKNPWDINIPKRNYKISTVITSTEDNRQITYNKMSIDVGGKQYDIPIDSSEVKQVLPEKRFRYEPNLYLSLSSGYNTSSNIDNTASMGLSFINYGNGLTKDLVFANLGFVKSLNNFNYGITLKPVMYNVRKNINFLQNTYIAPDLSFMNDKSFFVGLSLSVGL